MSYELTIEPIGQTIEVEEDQTILDAALRAGIWLPHACCLPGLCATCKVQVRRRPSMLEVMERRPVSR